jgi:hypothetical protein
MALQVLDAAAKTKKYPLTVEAIAGIVKQIQDFATAGYPVSSFGAVQRTAICSLATQRNAEALRVSESAPVGAGIKQQYIAAVKGTAAANADIQAVIDKIFLLRPSLPEARTALTNGRVGWMSYITKALAANGVSAKTAIRDALTRLWNAASGNQRELLRRVLLKLPPVVAGKGGEYPQDLPVKGVSEHNIYNKVFDTNTTTQIVALLFTRCNDCGIATTAQLIDAINREGRAIVKSGFEYDVVNGTVIMPSLYYIENRLEQQGYVLTTPIQAFSTPMKGYHGELFGANSLAFNSVQAICSPTGAPIALFKAKYFSSQEFDRRVKEEGFVSFTSAFKADMTGAQPVLRPLLPDVPRIMFVDTEQGWSPSPVAIRQLVRLGWTVFFNFDEMLTFLRQLDARKIAPVVLVRKKKL